MNNLEFHTNKTTEKNYQKYGTHWVTIQIFFPKLNAAEKLIALFMG